VDDGESVWHERAIARGWDASGGARLPTRVEQQEILLALLREARVGERVVLDLGVGSGLVAEAVLDALPEASLVGIDFSDAMLELARARLDRFGSRVQLVRHDLADVGDLALPAGRYAAAFSVQTLHHLSDAAKEAAIAWSAAAVEPGGLIVIVDRVAVPESLFCAWAAVWRRIDPAVPATYAEYEEQLAQGGDRPASVHDQLSWLRNVGLDAMCVHAYGNRVVLVGCLPNR
jgi:ubiquinone/menaquinone biosynthesis C-methylase UbiE